VPNTTLCPSCGANSLTSDYCDSCGTALAAPAAAAAPGPAATPAAAPAAGLCPNCGAARAADDTFCEGCGLDFATGQMPAAPAPTAAAGTGAPSGWTAVVEADRAFFDSNEAEGATSIVFPEGAGSRDVPLTGDENWIGRRSEAKGFFPAIDLGSPITDPGVSHRHAVLRKQVDGSWALVDEMSTNGTYLNGSASPLPHGVVTALHDGDRLNIGSFTAITIVKDPAAP
jgi:hypothetical protein